MRRSEDRFRSQGLCIAASRGRMQVHVAAEQRSGTEKLKLRVRIAARLNARPVLIAVVAKGWILKIETHSFKSDDNRRQPLAIHLEHGPLKTNRLLVPIFLVIDNQFLDERRFISDDVAWSELPPEELLRRR